LSVPALALYWGSLPNYGCPPIRGRVPGLSIVLPGWGDPSPNFWGSVAVVFWGFGVRCVRVKLVSSSLGSILWVIAELRMPTYKGEGTWATHSLTGLGRPLRQFFGVRCGSFLGLLARCGRVKLVSSSLGSILGVIAELRMPTYKEEGTWATHSLTGLGRPLRQFFGVRCGSFLGLLARCGRLKLVSSSLGSILGVIAELRMPTHYGEVPGLSIVLPGWGDLP